MSKHTEGKWKAAKHLIGDGWRVFVQHEADADMHDAIADLETWQTDGTTEANAHLIAAAPEMLAALEGVIHHNDALKEKYKLSPSLIRQVEAAISKAKGN